MRGKRRIMKVCNVWLGFFTFLLFFLGEFFEPRCVVRLMLFLTGVGPLLAWRKSSTESLKRNFGWPLGIGLAAGVIALVFGFREFYSWICLLLCVFVASTVGMEFYRGARVIRARSGASFMASAVDLTLRNTRPYPADIIYICYVFTFFSLDR